MFSNCVKQSIIFYIEAFLFIVSTKFCALAILSITFSHELEMVFIQRSFVLLLVNHIVTDFPALKIAIVTPQTSERRCTSYHASNTNAWIPLLFYSSTTVMENHQAATISHDALLHCFTASGKRYFANKITNLHRSPPPPFPLPLRRPPSPAEPRRDARRRREHRILIGR